MPICKKCSKEFSIPEEELKELALTFSIPRQICLSCKEAAQQEVKDKIETIKKYFTDL
jgi:hypothetical protein